MLRVITFIDGSNLYSHLRDTYGEGKVRLANLSSRLTGKDRKLVEWRYYCAPLPQGHSPEDLSRYSAQQRFFHIVRRHRKGKLCLGRLEPDRDTGKLREKGVDVLLAIDVVRLAAENRYDVAVILSGDGDIVPAVATVREIYQKRVEVAIPPVDAYHMRQAADEYLEITPDLFNAVVLGKKVPAEPATMDGLKNKFNKSK